MPEATDNSLARFEKRSTYYPLALLGAFGLACLVAGIVFAVRAQDWPAAALFVVSLFITAVLTLLYVSRNRQVTAADDKKFIKWDAALPELQRQNVNLEVRELARLLGVEDSQMGDLLSAYVVAEDLALRQIQQEEQKPLLRHVSIGKAPFDAVLIDRDTITCVEVTFVVVPDVRQDKIDSMMKKVTLARKSLAEMKVRMRLRFLLALVTQLSPDEDAQLRDAFIRTRFKDIPTTTAEIRFYDFEDLQNIYITEEEQA